MFEASVCLVSISCLYPELESQSGPQPAKSSVVMVALEAATLLSIQVGPCEKEGNCYSNDNDGSLDTLTFENINEIIGSETSQQIQIKRDIQVAGNMKCYINYDK